MNTNKPLLLLLLLLQGPRAPVGAADTLIKNRFRPILGASKQSIVNLGPKIQASLFVSFTSIRKSERDNLSIRSSILLQGYYFRDNA